MLKQQKGKTQLNLEYAQDSVKQIQYHLDQNLQRIQCWLMVDQLVQTD